MRNRQAVRVIAFVLSFALLAWAQNPAPSRADDDILLLLDVLLANHTLTQQQYDALKLRITQRGSEPKAAASPQAAAPAPQNLTPGQPAAQKVVTAMDDAVGFHVGLFDVTFSGEINGFYVHDRADNSKAGCLLCLASTGAQPSSSIRNGLLPGDLSIKIATKQNDFDIAVFFGIWPGIQSLETGGLAGNTFGGVNLAPGNPTGFGVTGVDFRQQYVTVGKANMGTFKVGRDLGLFGQEAILNDFTLLGAGTTNGNVGPGSVTLGRIGLGYIYTDFMPQITWASPTAHGLQFTGGIFSPLSDVVSTTLGLPAFSAPLTGHGQPQFQTKLTYTVPTKGPAKAKFWTNFITQSMEANASDHTADTSLAILTGHNVRANGIDYGGKISIGAADFVASGYNGSGIGTEGLLFLATSPTGSKRGSQGGYFQGTYTFAKKTTAGVSWGESCLYLANSGETANSQAITRCNSSYVGQLRYSLTKWVNLVGEYTHTHSLSQGRVATTSDSLALGSIVFF